MTTTSYTHSSCVQFLRNWHLLLKPKRKFSKNVYATYYIGIKYTTHNLTALNRFDIIIREKIKTNIVHYYDHVLRVGIKINVHYDDGVSILCVRKVLQRFKLYESISICIHFKELYNI